jgi:hypothetical protein
LAVFNSKTYKIEKFHEIDINNFNLIVDDSIKMFVRDVLNSIEKQRKKKEQDDMYLILLKEEREKLETENIELLKNSKVVIFNEIDNDNDGTVDLIQGEDDFIRLLTKNQNIIIEVDKLYIQKFIQLSNYLRTKRKNIQLIYDNIKETYDISDFRDQVGSLKNQIYIYKLLLIQSLNMITSIIENDLITFYDIYEKFDKLNIFNSNWENEMSQKLIDIEDNLNDLLYSIEEMSDKIVNAIGDLSNVIEKSSNSIANQLKGVDSSIKFNNLLTGIQTYQLYKMRKEASSISKNRSN